MLKIITHCECDCSMEQIANGKYCLDIGDVEEEGGDKNRDKNDIIP